MTREPLSHYRGAVRAFMAEKSLEAAEKLWALADALEKAGEPKEAAAILRFFVTQTVPPPVEERESGPDDRGLPREVSIEEWRELNAAHRRLSADAGH